MSTHRHRQRRVWRLVAVVVFVVAGVLFVTSGLDAGGLDLRASSVTDLDTVVRQQRERADDLQHKVAELNRDVDTLGKSVDDQQVTEVQRQVDQLKGPAGFEKVRGPSVTVVLKDAPKEEIDRAVSSGEVTADQLVVHQQDIQAVVNALWSGGAEAMQIMDQRVIATSAVRCVGNTLILQGRVYSPPYKITAIGDPERLSQALDDSADVATYRYYVDTYGLVYQVAADTSTKLPGFDGSLDLLHAEAAP